MRAEVISIGDELTSGQRLDTNSQWLSQRLGELGIRVMFHTTVADDLAANVAVMRAALARAEIVVVTGGLGPTADDLTREALAAAVDRELYLDEGALADITALFSKRGREMPARNRVQAQFPVGSRIVPNPHGSAPGIDYTFTQPDQTTARVFCLPGVPAEMREMWSTTVVPALQTLLGTTRMIRHRVIKCFGVGESDLEAMLPDMIRRGREPQVGITVHAATISLRVTTNTETEAAAAALAEPTLATIRECLGTLVYGEGDDELEDAVLRLLAGQGVTLATAEWGTAGLLAHWLRKAATDTNTFASGSVLANAAALARYLGEDVSPIKVTRDAESGVRALAERCREVWGTTWGLAVGEALAAGSEGGVPKIWTALAGPAGTVSKEFPFTGHPDILVPRAAKQALNFLRLKLLEKSLA
jgi:nicotinamide-nucleotide amidase